MGFGTPPTPPYTLTKADIDAVLGYDVSAHASRHHVLPAPGADTLNPVMINAPPLDDDLRVGRDWLNDPSLSAAGLLRTRIGTELADQVLVAGHHAVSQIANLGGGVLVAGTRQTSSPYDGAIVRSVDYGATWTTIQSFSAEHIHSCIPLPGGIVLAGSSNSNVYRSTDRGLTWTEISGVVTGTKIISSLVYCGNGIVLACATPSDIAARWAKSTDYGATWVDKGVWAIDYMGSYASALAYLENGIVLMALAHRLSSHPLRVARSTDYGDTWSVVTIAASWPLGKDILAVCYLGNGIVFASSSGDLVVAVSSNHGVTWSLKTVPHSLSSLVYLGDGLVLGGALGHPSIWRTEDYGSTWSEESHAAIANSGDHYWLEFLENGLLLAATGPACKLLRSEEWPLKSGRGGGDFVQPTGLIEVPADHEVLGRTVRGQAGEILALFDVCYMESDGKLWKAKADAAGTMPGLYMATGALAADAYGTFLVMGYARDDTWTWTVGAILHAFDDTAGAMVEAAPSDPGDQVQRLGIAVTADLVYFKPDVTVVEVA